MKCDLLDKWKYYTKDLISPDSYIEMGFFYLMAAAMQRRLWLGDTSGLSQLFPNMYIILVGPPACGKGLVLKQVIQILKHYKITHGNEFVKAEEAAVKALAAELGIGSNLSSPIDFDNYLIPVSADATTYEQLLRIMTRSTRIHEIKETKQKYVHKSLCFCLEEISSLFRRKAEDVVRFLIVAFDCGDYDYETKHFSADRIRKM